MAVTWGGGTVGWSGGGSGGASVTLPLPLADGGTEADLSAVAKGDLIVGTAAGTVGIKAVGADGTFLKANSGAAGGVEWAAGGGGITNGAGANVIPKSDGTNLVASAISEASAGSLATSAGTALGLTATAPAATTGASQAGIGVTITASPAVASTDTAGAADGAPVTLRAGDAARNTSGNGHGGIIRTVFGAGVGIGRVGLMTEQTTSGTGMRPGPWAYSALLGRVNNNAIFTVEETGRAIIGSAGYYGFAAATSVSETTYTMTDLAIVRAAAGVARVTTGTGAGIGSVLNARLVEANTAGSGTPNALAATESNTVLTNEGSTAANYHTLPTAAAGLTFTFVVQDGDGLRCVANTGDTIRVIDKVTAAAGYIESTTIGSVVTLVAINATEWVAISIHGTWTDGTFTYDDTGLTTP